MTRGAVPVLAIVALLFPVRASAQAGSPPNDPLTLPRAYGAFSIDRLATWIKAVKAHEPGSADVHAQIVAVLTRWDLSGATRDFWTLRDTVQRRGVSANVPGWDGTVNDALVRIGLSPDEAVGSEIVKRAILLHTDVAAVELQARIALVESVGLPRLDSATNVPLAGVHLSAASACVQRLQAHMPDDPFVRQWYVSVAALLQRRREVEAAAPFVDRAVSLFSADPDLLLIQGYVHEHMASPDLRGAVDVGKYDRRTPVDHLRIAEHAYRQVVERRAMNVELGLRLGRVVGLLGRHEEARSLLASAQKLPADRVVQYFLFLFAGLEEEALGRDDRARISYLRAQSFFPSASSAYLALSHLAHQTGDTRRAAAVVQQMLSLDSNRVDPWRFYAHAGHEMLSDQLLFDLRKPFTRMKTQ